MGLGRGTPAQSLTSPSALSSAASCVRGAGLGSGEGVHLVEGGGGTGLGQGIHVLTSPSVSRAALYISVLMAALLVCET